MPFFFEPFPKINYDIKKNDNTTSVTNIFVRFKIQEYFRSTTAVYYDYTIQDQDRPDIIAAKYYDDASLDWVILLTNSVIDPHFDWPLSQENLDRFIIKKYGNMASAKGTIKQYEQIVQPKTILFDGTIVPETVYVVTQATYNTLSPNARREVTNYDYEIRVNEAKRQIKIIDKDYIGNIVNNVGTVFE
jgi:hypothetical protein